ncbi:MAG: S1-like domain-containing RNA-binding protein [Halioglobus sp.]
MLEVGKFQKLQILEKGAYGVILDGQDQGRLLLPLIQCPEDANPADELEVFVYLDSEGDPVPTTYRPAAELGQVAWLKIVSVSNIGAFADWGLNKDLFIPFAEQQHKLIEGRQALVKIYLDNQGRLAGSTRVDHWIKDDAAGFKRGEKVSLMIADRTELGFKAIVNHEYWGLLYSNELYQKVSKGQQIEGYVKQVREDGRLDLTLSKPGFSKDRIQGVTDAILAALEDNNGFITLTDKSPPPEIYAAFGVSKKVFKQAVGSLFKQRLITLEKTGIRKN